MARPKARVTVEIGVSAYIVQDMHKKFEAHMHYKCIAVGSPHGGRERPLFVALVIRATDVLARGSLLQHALKISISFFWLPEIQDSKWIGTVRTQISGFLSSLFLGLPTDWATVRSHFT